MSIGNPVREHAVARRVAADDDVAIELVHAVRGELAAELVEIAVASVGSQVPSR